MNTTLVPVETRSTTKMFRVDINGKPVGLIEKMRDSRTDKNPWKAFLGIGNTKFLGVCYPAHRLDTFAARSKCVEAIEAAYQGLPYVKDGFEKAHGAETIFNPGSVQ